MALTSDIVQSWHSPRRVVRRLRSARAQARHRRQRKLLEFTLPAAAVRDSCRDAQRASRALSASTATICSTSGMIGKRAK